MKTAIAITLTKIFCWKGVKNYKSVYKKIKKVL